MKDTRFRKCLKKTVSALVFFSVMATSVVGFAYRIDYPGGNNAFTLSGKTEDAMAGQIVTLKVVNADTVVYTRQTETNESGEYEFEFDVSDDVPNGYLAITVNDGDAAKTYPIYKSNADEVTRALTSAEGNIVAAVNANDTVTTTPVKDILRVDETKFGANGILVTYVNAAKPHENLPDFQDAYKKGLFLQELAKADADVDELYEFMDDSEMAGLVTVKAGGKFNAYSESEKKAVLTKMRGTSCADDKAFKEALAEAVIENELSKVTTDNEKWGVLSNNNDYLLMPLDTYEDSSVFEDLKTQLFALLKDSNPDKISVSEIKDKADEIYTTLTQDGGDGGDGGSGGSGGGSGGSGGGDRESVTVGSGLITPPAQSVTFGFSDLAGYDWARDAILLLAADGIINGKSEGIFAPGDNVTRAEFAKIIMGAFDLVDNSATANFADTPKSHWGYTYVASAVSKEIVTGVSASSFNPDGKITRQDMATICYRVLKRQGIETSSAEKKEFADANQVSDYAKEAVDALSGLGIINGKGNGRFAPKDYATRAEAAKIIHLLRALN